MTRGQLKDIVKFEAGLADADIFDVWIEEVIQETLNSLTALTKCQELKVVDFEVTLTAATRLVTIPAAQHIDRDNIYFLTGGDHEQGYLLQYFKDDSIVNVGRSFAIYQAGPTQLAVFPYDEIEGTDKLLFTYWAYPILANDAAVIPVENLVNQLRHEVVAQAVLHGDSKKFTAHRSLAKEAQSRAFGAFDVNDT